MILRMTKHSCTNGTLSELLVIQQNYGNSGKPNTTSGKPTTQIKEKENPIMAQKI